MSDDSAFLALSEASLDYPVRFMGGARAALDRRDRRSAIGSEILEVGRGAYAVRALDRVTLELTPGDRLGIMGNNGAGKSTLLKVLAGILGPTEGRRLARGRLTTIFNIRLGFDMEQSGYDNILVRSLLSGRRRAEVDRRLPEIADYSGLGEYLHLPLRTYSNGMLARLAFSIATAWDDSILLMDEWIGAGDAAFFAKAEERLKNYVGGVEILAIATHNPGILRRFCNVAIVMNRGALIFRGSVEESLRFFSEQQKAEAAQAAS